MAENKLGEIIATSLEEIKKVVEANTIIGEPINTPSGTIIIPVSKISMGFASGGVDATKEKGLSFSGGGGTGATVTPVAFLIVNADGKVTMLNVLNPTEAPDYIGTVTGFIEKTPDIVAKFKDIFKKDGE